MKTKVLALILAILCLSMSVVGCDKGCTEHVDENKDAKCDNCEAAMVCTEHVDEDENLACDVCAADLTPACEKHVDANADEKCDNCKAVVCKEHKDENADNLCDACGGAVVTVSVQVAPTEEERVDMVVATIPTDVSLDAYLNTSVQAGVEYGKAQEIEYNERLGFFALTIEESDRFSTYTVSNLKTGETVFTRTNSYSLNSDTSCYVELNEYYFTVVEHYFGEIETKTTYEYYSYKANSNPFYVDIVSAEDEFDGVYGEEIDSYDGVAYYKLSIGDRVFIFAPETYELIFADMDAKVFADRPSFDVTNDTYGYIYTGDKIYVYDLSKWIDCVYVYEIPSYADEFDWYVLANGNILFQMTIELNNSAVSYDFLEYGSKYDLVTALIDLDAKSVKEVEFGYYISGVQTDNYPSIIKDTTPNLAVVYSIVNDRVDSSAMKILALDNDLTVLYDFDQTLDLSAYANIVAVGENLFMVERYLGGQYVTEIVNEKGEHVNYLPESAYYNGVWVEYNGKYYNVKMELILDPEADGYYAVSYGARYVILEKYNEETEVYDYFCFNGTGSPKKIQEDIVSYDWHELGYVLVVKIVDDEDNDAYEYRLYGTNQKLIATSDVPFNGSVNWLDEDCTVGIFSDWNGNTYLVK